MTDDAPRAEVACGEWSKPRRFAACPWMTRPRERPCRTVCVDLFQDGPQRVNPGGPEPVLPTGLPCELHSSPDWAWRSPEKQNGDPRHSCSNVEFTIVTRRRPRRTRQEVTNHERELPPRGGAGGAGSKSVGGSRNGHLKRGVTAYKSGSRRSWSAA